MRKLFFLFCIFSTIGLYAQKIDVVQYKFILALTDENDTIQGNAVIRFVPLTNDTTVSFDLASVNNNGKGMKVFSVDANTKIYTTSTFTQNRDQLFIYNKNFKKGDTAAVKILYKGIPADGLVISKNKHGDRTFFADNWPNRAHYWLPCNDKPDDKSPFFFSVIAPASYSVISNGIKVVEEKAFAGYNQTTWKEDTPLPTKVMVIGVAKFATKFFDDSPKDVPVSAWVYPQDSAKGFYDYALTTDILKFFSGYIAPFPYKKLANVQSKTIFGGMENASCIFYAESSVTGDRSEEDLYAHEIAHQWFGDMASEKSFAHLWLSEGFATYMTDIYFEHKYGKEAFNKRLQKERDEAVAFAKGSTHPVVDTTSNLMSLLNANSYQKGAWVLHMLRQEVGDSIFHKIIQTYYNTYKGSNADTRDFEAVAEKVSRKDLRWFFDQWLYGPGIPLLTVKPYAEKDLLMFTINQTQTNLKRFVLEIEVTDVVGNRKRFAPVIQEKETVLKYTFGSRIKKIEIDPDNKLLFEEVKR